MPQMRSVHSATERNCNSNLSNTSIMYMYIHVIISSYSFVKNKSCVLILTCQPCYKLVPRLVQPNLVTIKGCYNLPHNLVYSKVATTSKPCQLQTCHMVVTTFIQGCFNNPATSLQQLCFLGRHVHAIPT